LGEARTEPAGAEALGQAEAHRRRKADMVRAGFDATPKRLAEILESGGLTEVWQEVARRCYSCGSCNTTCPTCFCFDMDDAFDLTLRSGERVRTWDSCQLQEFATVAGGHNFREERWQRVRHRWHRKFAYLFRQLGRPYCVGCGRCSRACTADINIVDVTNGLIAAGRKEAAHA
jgi:ferredoxin